MPDSTRLSVRVQPRASRNEVVGFDSTGVLRIRVTAPPVDGEANKAVVRLLADVLGVAASAIAVASGRSGRNKIVDIEGIGQSAAMQRLAR